MDASANRTRVENRVAAKSGASLQTGRKHGRPFEVVEELDGPVNLSVRAEK